MSSGNNIESEYSKLNSKNEWSAIFQKIRSESVKNSSPYTEALKPQNKNLNRYRDVSPYDHSRIVLKRGSTDYINANLIKVEKANRQYILTQGPLCNTVSHFWLMVWEQHSKAVLMLNKLVEKKQEKCYQYWPSKVGPDYIMTMEDVGLTLEYVEQQDHSYYLQRVLRLTDISTKESRDILQFHYTTWPDFGVPSSPTAFLEFLRKVRDAGVLEPTVGPAVVHCSAGIGRSGTFCLVDSCLVLMEKFGLNSVDVKEILCEMRSYRMGLIQTPEQLRFSYQAIIEGAKQLLNPDSSPTENHIIVDNEPEDGVASDSDDDGPPPLPPPRLDSLKKQNGTPLDRPLPNIPKSISLNEFSYEGDSDEYIPTGPLPVVPGDEEEGSSEDELEDLRSDSPCSEPVSPSDSLSASELRHRKRVEQREKLEAQVRDMKRRQQANEQWTQLKRSLYKPLFIAGAIVLGGGLISYFYFKN
ncbi:tyrosine-protein phosphatase non-receptor type 61F isoform X1 [Tribolium castaneum]|uniref:protein-tyrosine-phosphatase n=1 Tax=Tribolium castaneum TaxID=7070 RepID=D6WF82_TRICA|nr:PREDICTED: tyrosine-protein phosphatase non-receptor type 61F isoform X1 [Tribolium castaneum]EFA00470.2 Tyrosine-protein phosphatase non-receptor type 61F-like Protein [Tribolium castaneum]|eukprot:XP_008190655.1 PREDICTED: tyrosine-protein phosphatase non-receptor type 61F isoform X1 [Tribolium castaneum]